MDSPLYFLEMAFGNCFESTQLGTFGDFDMRGDGVGIFRLATNFSYVMVVGIGSVLSELQKRAGAIFQYWE